MESATLEKDDKIFGFWVYLMTDLVIFAVLFACFLVLRNSTYKGPSGKDLFELNVVVSETLILLASSFTCSLGTYTLIKKRKWLSILWFGLTFFLGGAFLFLELEEFAKFIERGSGPSRSAFLSSFFTLVGTHGLHIFFGLLWMAFAILRIALKPLTHHAFSQLYRMAFFWHFLDFVWIFIFTVVYGLELLYA